MTGESERGDEKRWGLLTENISPDTGLDERPLPRLPLRMEESDPTPNTDYDKRTGYLFDSTFPPEQRRLY